MCGKRLTRVLALALKPRIDFILARFHEQLSGSFKYYPYTIRPSLCHFGYVDAVALDFDAFVGASRISMKITPYEVKLCVSLSITRVVL